MNNLSRRRRSLLNKKLLLDHLLKLAMRKRTELIPILIKNTPCCCVVVCGPREPSSRSVTFISWHFHGGSFFYVGRVHLRLRKYLIKINIIQFGVLFINRVSIRIIYLSHTTLTREHGPTSPGCWWALQPGILGVGYLDSSFSKGAGASPRTSW